MIPVEISRNILFVIVILFKEKTKFLGAIQTFCVILTYKYIIFSVIYLFIFIYLEVLIFFSERRR